MMVRPVKIVTRKCQELGIAQLPWPGQSPDCNPIENLWSLLKTKVRLQAPRTIEQLREVVSHVWFHEIPLDYCQRLVNSMPYRLKSVIHQKGFPTRY